ncbi:MAG: FtsX-like permease family protein [Bacteroidales bacterium]
MNIFLTNIRSAILKYKAASIMIFIGLSIAYTIVTALLVQFDFEYNYNRNFSNKNIYRLEIYDSYSNGLSPYLPKPLTDIVTERIPQLNNSCIFTDIHKVPVIIKDYGKGEKYFNENFALANVGIVSVFDLEVIKGNYIDALTLKNNVILPMSLATKFYGGTDAVGKEIYINGKDRVIVAAIYKDLPVNSSLKNAVYSSIYIENDWQKWIYYNYYQIYSANDIKQIEASVCELKEYMGLMEDSENISPPKLRPLKEVYFSSEGNKLELFALLSVAILILMIAVVNFTNFTISLSPVRIKSFNIHNICGANLFTLKKYIIYESVLFSISAYLLSIIICYGLSVTSVQELLDTSLIPHQNLTVFVFGFVLCLAVGLIAGLYPAKYMTNFQPATIIRGPVETGLGGIKLKNALTIFQYTISIILTILTIFILQEVHLLENKSWGFNKDNVLYFEIGSELEEKKTTLISELKQNKNVQDVAFSSEIWGDFQMCDGERVINGENRRIWMYYNNVSYNFLDFWNIPVEDGMKINVGDSCAVINESFAEILGKERALSENFFGLDVKAIAKDFNFLSFREQIQPVILSINDNDKYKFCFVKTSGFIPISEIVSFINDTASKISPSFNGNINYIDSYLSSLYSKENRLCRLISIFCAVSLILTMMGIGGQGLFNFKSVIKEIAIRKVYGATFRTIIILLNKTYTKLSLFSFCIACPIAYFIITSWLKNFQYRINVSVWIFIFSGASIILLTILIMGAQTHKSASANPINILKML